MKDRILHILGYAALIITAAFVVLDLFVPVMYYDTVKKYCDDFDVEPSLVFSVIWTESKFDSSAISSKGAVGLMQLMPSTARWMAQSLDVPFDERKLLDPDYNIMLGVKYLSYLSGRFEGDRLLAAYNAGEGKVSDWGDEIPISETARYVKRVNLLKRVYSFRLGG